MATRGMRADWGCVQEVERGRRYRIRWWAKGPDGYRRRSKTVRGTRRQAMDELARLRLDHSGDAPCPTVGEVWDRWVAPDLDLMVENGDLSHSTRRIYAGSWRRHVAPRWASEPVDAPAPLAIQQWITSDLGTANIARFALLTLRRVMDYAVRYELRTDNPCAVKYVMPSQATIKRADSGTWDLAGTYRLWASMRGSWLEALVILCGFAGCRPGEAMGVRASDVEWGEEGGVPWATVRIERQVTTQGLTDRLKTRRSRRPVTVVGEPARRLADLCRADPPGGWLVGDGLGGVSAHQTVNSSWPGPHPVRNLRNSWQTWMRWEARVEPWLIERMMGHAGEGVTGRHYDRPDAEVQREVMVAAYRERIEAVERDALGT